MNKLKVLAEPKKSFQNTDGKSMMVSTSLRVLSSQYFSIDLNFSEKHHTTRYFNTDTSFTHEASTSQ